MAYSDRLNGYWEEGYHFYIKIRDDKMIVREYRRKVTLETRISYDAVALDAGQKTMITLENNVLSVGGSNNPMSWFEEFYYEDGLLHAVEGFSFMDRKDPFTIKKVDHGPFDHIVIRDEEYLPKLQGVWVQWSPVETKHRDALIIKGNHFSWRLHEGDFHVISYDKQNYDPDKLYIVPLDLTEDSFGSCSQFEIYPDMITGYEMVFDMSVPMSVFAREEDIDKIKVPNAAKTPARSVMCPTVFDDAPIAPANIPFCGTMISDPPKPGDTSMSSLFEKMKMDMVNAVNQEKAEETDRDDTIPKPVFIPVEKEGDDPYRLKEPYKCPCCGTVFEDHLAKFCWSCGNILRR